MFILNRIKSLFIYVTLVYKHIIIIANEYIIKKKNLPHKEQLYKILERNSLEAP